VILLAETIRLDARLASANAALQRERDSRMMSFKAVASAISHEIKQALTAIAANGAAAQQLLGLARPTSRRRDPLWPIW